MSPSIENESLDTLAGQMGGREALARIIAMYSGKLPEEIEGLGVALRSGDLATVQSSAHRLKSSSGQLGARRLQVMLAGLERAAADGDAESARRIFAEVKGEAEEVRIELESFSA